MLKVPTEIDARLRALEATAIEAEGLARSAFAKVEEIDNQVRNTAERIAKIEDGGPLNEAGQHTVAGLKETLARQEGEAVSVREKATRRVEKARADRKIHTQCRDWLAQTPHGVVFRTIELPTVKDVGDVIAAISSTRESLEAVKAQRGDVKRVWLERDELKQLAAQWVEKMGRSVVPQIGGVKKGDFDFRFEHLSIARTPTSQADFFGPLCHLFPQLMVSALARVIDDTVPADVATQTRAEREAQLVALDGKILEIERYEEALIREAHARGFEHVARRGRASPAAVLGVEVVKLKAVAA